MEPSEINVTYGKTDGDLRSTPYRICNVKSIAILNNDGQEVTIPLDLLKYAFTGARGIACNQINDEIPDLKSTRACLNDMGRVLKYYMSRVDKLEAGIRHTHSKELADELISSAAASLERGDQS